MHPVFQLFVKDIKTDWRNRYPVLGLILYLISVIVISYMSFVSFISTEVWNALFWLIILFTSVNAIAKSFIQEENRSVYYYFLTSPSYIIISKLLYANVYQFILVIITFVLFGVFLGYPEMVSFWFLINLLLGSLGLASAFTMVSAMASKTENSSMLMAILGFPVIIPILLLAISNSGKLLMGATFYDVSSNLLTLLSVNVIIIALSLILFPFTWKS